MLEKENAPSEWGFGCGASDNGVSNHESHYTTFPDVAQQNMCQNDTQQRYTETQELAQRFAPHKVNSISVSESYQRIGFMMQMNESDREKFYRRSERVARCGDYLEFVHDIIDGNIEPKGKLHNANFCRDRMCPMCQYRRSLKIFGQVSQIMDGIKDSYEWLFLTLTVPNVPGFYLSEKLDELNKAFKRLTQYKRVKTVLRGAFKALEITYNRKRDDYHPHFHCILAVKKGYLTSRDYIKQQEWLELWRRAYKDDSITQVDIRSMGSINRMMDGTKNSDLRYSKAVAEAAKYSVKSSDFLFDDLLLTDSIIFELSKTLENRRFASFSGVLKDEYQRLGLDDAEDENADLTHITDKPNTAVSWLIRQYEWKCGVYALKAEYIEGENEHGE